jgi:hypothetical protein
MNTPYIARQGALRRLQLVSKDLLLQAPEVPRIAQTWYNRLPRLSSLLVSLQRKVNVLDLVMVRQDIIQMISRVWSTVKR